MGARQSAEDAPPATPAEYARRELSKPVDDDALRAWLRREEDGDSIKERLREALAQHKDASEADHVRESEERTKQELADVKRELAAMAATQQIILAKLQTILDDKQP